MLLTSVMSGNAGDDFFLEFVLNWVLLEITGSSLEFDCTFSIRGSLLLRNGVFSVELPTIKGGRGSGEFIACVGGVGIRTKVAFCDGVCWLRACINGGGNIPTGRTPTNFL